MRDQAPRRPARGDRVLVRRLRSGDEGALVAAYDQHADVVFGIVRRVTGDGETAREVTQEVFVQLWEHPERVDPDRGSLRAYLAVMAHRRAVDQVRRRVRRGRAEAEAARARPAVEAGHEPGIVEAAGVAWRNERLKGAVQELPDDQRAALMLAYFDGCTYSEVARVLGIPEGTAKSRLRLALAHLRAALADDLREWV